jgi:predicted RNA-binding Zn-ribbon protein involved in translation (DUF1610 family)
MHGLETLKKLNSETGREEKVCPKCGGALLKSGTCAGFSYCEECGWVVQDDS